jgi:Flp pilus assembly protein TadG
MVEFALVSIILVFLLGGAIEFGFLFADKLALNNAARSGARWATDNSVTAPATIWSGAASAPVNSIEGQVQSAGSTAGLPNQDITSGVGIKIEYFDTTGAAPVLCGHVHAAGGTASYVADNADSQAQCVARGNLVRVTVSNTYPFVTKLLSFLPTPVLNATATFEVMN